MKQAIPLIPSGAIFNTDRTHRLQLWRIWNPHLPTVLFIGLNPSRADETKNDPTITRCIGFAHSWQKYGGIYFANLYSFRTPDPAILKKAISVGDAWTEDTDFNLQEMIERSKIIICCWGSWNFIEHRVNYVNDFLIKAHHDNAYCFGVNANGSPKHPLYLSKSTSIAPYPSPK